MKNLTRLSLALYAASLLAPWVHEVWVEELEEASCQQCESLASVGATLTSRCDENRPCENPDHHHHHRHHSHSQCTVCQHTQAVGLQVATGLHVATRLDVLGRAIARQSGCHRRRELCLHLARAPPLAS